MACVCTLWCRRISLAAAQGGLFAARPEERVYLLGSYQSEAELADREASDAGSQVLGSVSAQQLLDLEVRSVLVQAVPSAGRQVTPSAGAGAGAGAASGAAAGAAGSARAVVETEWIPLYVEAASSVSAYILPLFRPALSEASIHFDAHYPGGGRWLVTSLSFMDNLIQVCAAPNRSLLSATGTGTGTGTEQQSSWQCAFVAPVDPQWAADVELISYAAKAHPVLLLHQQQQLAGGAPCHAAVADAGAASSAVTALSPLDIVVSYVANAVADLNILYDSQYRGAYVPRFIRVQNAV
jgi:hypothetical protein